MSDNSDIHEFKTGSRAAVRRVCRASYTLNNAQPVRCTIIGDQPLFYMDNHYGADDEDAGLFFDPSELDNIEHEIESLKKEIEAFERLAQTFEKEAVQSTQEFSDDKNFVTIPQSEQGCDNVEALLSILGKSRLASTYIDFALQYKVEIEFCTQVEDAIYERKTGRILINPVFNQADQILLAVRELRRHWQHRQGALINPLMFHPDNAILINRVQNADLTVAMVRIAWELQLSSERTAWEHLENSSLADLAHAFAREAFLDFRTINNGQASAAVMESWFLSERCRHEDKKLIKQMLADYRGYVFDHEEAQKNLTPSLISALGSMPFGKNYLAAHISTLISDPLFTEVRDRSNSNFLWFIKFERSFRETERDLQSSGQHATKGSLNATSAAPASKKAQRKNYENNKAAPAAIVTLYPSSDKKPKNKAGDKTRNTARFATPKSAAARNTGKGSTNVVYLRRWSGE